ncbi:MAG: hypothetical protein P1V51_19225 [Deltaproteobacteria bacterium]|nr:hypothetical protein [Deltaproteobacteria bacterium]
MRRRRLPKSLTYSALVLVAMGCSSSGGSGCGCGETPLATDMDEAEKIYDGMLLQVTPEGLNYVEANFTPIVESFMAGGLAFDMPAGGNMSCPTFGCNSQQVICEGGSPCPITADIHDIALSTVAADRLHLSANLDVTAPNIPLGICQNLFVCAEINFDLAITVTNKPISADVVLGVDPLMKVTTFDLENLDVSLSCNDFRVEGGLLCDMADWGFIRDLIAGFANGMLQDQINGQVQGTIDDMTCMPCDYFTAGCATGVGGGATCDGSTGWCMNPTTSSCVRSPMGMVGNLDVGQLLGALTGGASAPIDVFVAPGQEAQPVADPYVRVNGAPLDLRVITGSYAQPHACVPDASSLPATDPPPRIDFPIEATNAGVNSFHAGVGVSDRFLDKFLYDLYRGGGLCLNIGSDTLDLISAGLFKTFLPSLDSLTEGRNAPMFIGLRPKDRPTVDIGAGTWHDENGVKVIDEPLLTVNLPDLHLDFYAQIEERMVRLFTLKMDLALPLALEFTAQNELVPILGDLGSLVTNIQAMNSEILAEDPAVLEDLIPAIIGLIEPMLADALGPIALPDLQGFGLDVKKIGGMVARPSEPGHFEHMGILADLLFNPATPAPFVVETGVTVLDVRTPLEEAMRPVVGVPLPRPEVRLALSGHDARKGSPGLEWQYRIDGGFWSPFSTARQITVRARQLLLPGRHRIEVRARALDDYHTLDPTPAAAEVIIDWAAPTARLLVEPESGVVRVEARDDVTPAGRLEYAFARDGGAFTSFGPEAETTLGVDDRSLEARVRDEAGNVKTLVWQSSIPELRSALQPAGGCESARGPTGLGLSLLLAGLALLGLRRRR